MGYSKAHTIKNDFETFRRLLRWLAVHESGSLAEFGWELMSYAVFVQFLAHGLTAGNKGNDFARLRNFYKWAARMGLYAEFDQSLARAIKKIRAQGNVKGADVRFHDKKTGPFDSAERKLIIAAIDLELSSAEDLACVMIHLELGPDPNAVVRIRSDELIKFEANIVEDGKSKRLVRYQIEVPRIKKRTENRETKARPISLALGQLLEQLKPKEPSAPLFYWLNQNDPEHDLYLAMQRFVDDADLVSPRTGERLRMFPRRFRTTLATEMFEDGESEEHIAEALDHTDLQNLKPYREVNSHIVGRLGPKFNDIYGPVAAAVKGKLVDPQTGSALPGVPPQIVPASSPLLPILNVNVGGIGMCGKDVRKDGLCELAPPLSCYGCLFFAPFPKGPHEEVRDSLKQVLGETADPRIRKQLVKVIDAVERRICARGKGGEK